MTPFGHTVRSIRSTQGITLTELAIALGITPSYLSSLELGKRGRVPEKLVDKIADRLELSDRGRATLKILAQESDSVITIPENSEPWVYKVIHDFVDKVVHGSELEKCSLWSFVQGMNAETDPVPISTIPSPINKQRRPPMT